MKYIRQQVCEEEFKKLVNKFDVELGELGGLTSMDFKDTITLAWSIVNRLSQLIPKELYQFLSNNGDLETFKDGLAKHLAYKTEESMLFRIDKPLAYNQVFITARDYLNNIVAENEEYYIEEKHVETFYSQGPTNYTRALKGGIGQYLKLDTLTDTKNRGKYRINTLISPFVAFLSIHQYVHNKYKKAKVSTEEYGIMKRYCILYGEFVTQYQFQTSTLYEIDGFKMSNFLFFESEYNTHLINVISRMDKSKFLHPQEAVKVLCMSCLLPNIIDRTKLVEWLSESLKDVRVHEELDNYADDQCTDNKSMLKQREREWYRQTIKTIIHLSHFTIPLLEKLHNYLYNSAARMGKIKLSLSGSYDDQSKLQYNFSESITQLPLSEFNTIHQYMQEIINVESINSQNDFIESLDIPVAPDNSERNGQSVVLWQAEMSELIPIMRRIDQLVEDYAETLYIPID